MEEKEKLELEAYKILNKYDVAEACNQAFLDDVLYGTSCIVIDKNVVKRIEPYSEEWFRVNKL